MTTMMNWLAVVTIGAFACLLLGASAVHLWLHDEGGLLYLVAGTYFAFLCGCAARNVAAGGTP